MYYTKRDMKNGWVNVRGEEKHTCFLLFQYCGSWGKHPDYWWKLNKAKFEPSSVYSHWGGELLGIGAVMMTSCVFVFAPQSSSRGWRKAGCLRRKTGNRGLHSVTPAAAWSTWRWVRWSSVCPHWASALTLPCHWRASCECLRDKGRIHAMFWERSHDNKLNIF